MLLKEDHSWPLVSVHAWVRVGSVDEQPTQAGIAHILEHMVFKGTRHLHAAEISRWVEVLGGAMNAETSKEYTHYYVDVPSAGTQKAVHLLGEMLHRAILDPKEWQRECPVILEEIKRRNDDPEALLWDLLNEALFEEEPLRRPVIGSEASVAGMSRDSIWDFYRAFYKTENSLVVVAGNFKPKLLLDWIYKSFDTMPRGTAPARDRFVLGPYAQRHMSLKRPVKQSYMALGFPTPPSSHPDHEALDVIATILGEGRSSRLVQILREKKRLVWSIGTAHYGHEGPGIFSVFAECTPANRRRLRFEVEKLFNQLKKPTAQELTRAKNMIHNAWLQGFESYHQQAATLGVYALDNQLDRLKSYLPRVAAFTPAQLAVVAERYLHTLPLSTAVVEA